MLQPRRQIEPNHMEQSVPVGGRTLAQAYLQRIGVSTDLTAFYVKKEGKYQPFLWREFHDKLLSVVQYYIEQGVKAGDRVIIISQSRYEWTVVDIANLCLGVVTVPIYHSSSLEDTCFILNHCEPKIVFAEDAVQFGKIQTAFSKIAKTLPIVVFNSEAELQKGMSAFHSLNKGNGESSSKLREGAKQIKPSDLATIVYTSGTTGTPKGVSLSHENLLAEVTGVTQAVHIHSDDISVAFLPFAHILGRVESFLPIVTGMRIAFAESISTVPQNIAEIKPSILISVPRIYEKIYSKIQSEVNLAPQIKKTIFNWSVAVGRQVAGLKSEKKPIPVVLATKYSVADKLVFEKIRNKLGGRIRFAISGGAPLSSELAEFFFACGVEILEGYGLTETSAAITCNRPEDLCFGTVGKPIPGSSIRIANDGEIQMKGTVVFKEYYKNPAATKEAFTEDGWFCSGDIGEFNTRGFLRITDRKKELIVTSGGKNIAPQKLENSLKTNRLVSNAMVYGDREKYLVALITPNELELVNWAKSKNITFSAITDLVQNQEANVLYEDAVRTINQTLASYESIKRFKLLPFDFTVETGELTPSLKIKRKVITAKFKKEIEGLYDR